MRQYLVSGVFVFHGGATRTFKRHVSLPEGAVMDSGELEKLEDTLLQENNRHSSIAAFASINHFQQFEAKAPEVVINVKMDASKALTDFEGLVQRLQGLKATGEQLNLPEVLPPVGCPILISLSDVLVPVERIGHLRSREDEITYRLTDGKIIAGRFSWTYP